MFFQNMDVSLSLSLPRSIKAMKNMSLGEGGKKTVPA